MQHFSRFFCVVGLTGAYTYEYMWCIYQSIHAFKRNRLLKQSILAAVVWLKKMHQFYIVNANSYVFTKYVHWMLFISYRAHEFYFFQYLPHTTFCSCIISIYSFVDIICTFYMDVCTSYIQRFLRLLSRIRSTLSF